MSAEAQELEDRAGELRTLADDIEALLSSAKTYVQDTMTTWLGENRTEVEDAINSYKESCGAVAGELRGIATTLDSQAADARDEENNGQD